MLKWILPCVIIVSSCSNGNHAAPEIPAPNHGDVMWRICVSEYPTDVFSPYACSQDEWDKMDEREKECSINYCYENKKPSKIVETFDR